MSRNFEDYIRHLEEKINFLELIIDNIYNGVVITDFSGKILYFNKPYADFLGIDAKKVIGKDVREVIENTRMHIVAKTGKAELNKAHTIKGQDMVVQRIPIKKNGNVIGVFGQVMFKNVQDVTKLAKELSLLESKIKLYEEELVSLRSTRYTLNSIVGVSKQINDLKKEAAKAAGTNFPVLLTGESGTGKEVFAQAIHNLSDRRAYPFVRINCSAIPKELLEMELFGYEKGAFTGASENGKFGKFELANKGTVFLDEIGDMPLDMQPKLLRVLEEKEIERIGGKSPIKVDFRLIAASNQNMEELVELGKFRKDLFYRINVIRLNIPPLRERKEDIIPIAQNFLNSLDDDGLKRNYKINPESARILSQYYWNGNVRELINVLSRIICFIDREEILPCDIPLYIRTANPIQASSLVEAPKLEKQIQEVEKEEIIKALINAKNNKSKAAKILGIHRTHLYKKMRKYGIY